MDRIIVIGGGGHAASVIDTLLSGDLYDVVGIIDKSIDLTEPLYGIRCLGNDDNLQEVYDTGVKNAVIAIGSIGNTDLRLSLYKLVKKIGFKLPTIIDKTAVIGRNCTIGEGVFVGKGAVVNTLSEIGAMAIINSKALVEHQCRIGTFSHIAPGCILGGNVIVGEYTHIGIGTTVIQGIAIGERTLIGAGSVVVKNLGVGVKAYGNPCREVETT